MGAYVGTGSALAQKVWRPGVTHEAERQTLAMGFVGDDEDSVVVLRDDLTKKRGEKIQMNFSPTEEQSGFLDQDTIEGNEAEVNTLYDEFKIDYLGFAWRTRGVMSQQRVSFDQKKQVFIKASRVWARRWEQWFFNQVCGYTPAMYLDGATGGDNYKYTGMNPVVAPDPQHIIRPNHASETTDQGLDSNDTISLNYITDVLTHAIHRTAATEAAGSETGVCYPIAPDSEGFYHFIMSTRQWKRLRENTSAGDWQDIERAKMEGGKKYEKTGFYGTFLGIWNNIKLHVSDFIPNGVDSTAPQTSVPEVDRAVFLGACAAWWGYGEGYADGDHLDWSEEKLDHRKWSICVDTVGGCKTATFKDPTNTTNMYYGAIVCPTWEG